MSSSESLLMKNLSSCRFPPRYRLICSSSYWSTLLPSSWCPQYAYRQMLICFASSRSKSWISVSKSFRLRRQLNGASKSMKSSTNRPPAAPDDQDTLCTSSSSSSLLPETKSAVIQSHYLTLNS